MSEFPDVHITIPETFILESLSPENEVDECYEGKILYDVLRTQGKKPKYYYFRTRRDLFGAAIAFRKSQYRYLHLSCHGTTTHVSISQQDILYSDFASCFPGYLNNRRAFISGCDLGNNSFAESLFTKNTGMYSITAPTKKVLFSSAVVFWTSFYYLMNTFDDKNMKSPAMDAVLEKITDLYEFPVAHFLRNSGQNPPLSRCKEFNKTTWQDKLIEIAQSEKPKPKKLAHAKTSQARIISKPK